MTIDLIYKALKKQVGQSRHRAIPPDINRFCVTKNPIEGDGNDVRFDSRSILLIVLFYDTFWKMIGLTSHPCQNIIVTINSL